MICTLEQLPKINRKRVGISMVLFLFLSSVKNTFLESIYSDTASLGINAGVEVM